jgi:hypothetical protein
MPGKGLCTCFCPGSEMETRQSIHQVDKFEATFATSHLPPAYRILDTQVIEARRPWETMPL